MSALSLLLRGAFFVWELPQNVLGAAMYVHAKRRGKIESVVEYRGRLLIQTSAAISLGMFVFWSFDPDNPIFQLSRVNREHEYGHSVQSRMLGPLYLVVVGLPSFARTLFARWYHAKHGTRWSGYYRGFPEDWADRLGGVDSAAGEPCPRRRR